MSDRRAACAECGESFTTNQPNRKYCGKSCRDKARHRNYYAKHGPKLQVQVRECIVCGVTFTAHRASSQLRRKHGDQYRRTCSRECGAASIARTCADCGAKCGGSKRCEACKFERSRPRCPVVTGTECKWCGVFLVKWTGGRRARGGNGYCSRACWDMVNDPRRRMVTQIHYADCRECGTFFVGPLRKYFCSQLCAIRASNRDRRHRERAAGVRLSGSITLREVAVRDGWRCHLCGKKVPDRESRSRDLDPTIDHLIPLSDGGEHVPENVALAHFLCNSTRGARGTVQLRLAS